MRKSRDARHAYINMLLLRLPIHNVRTRLLRRVIWLLRAVHRTSQRLELVPALSRLGGFVAIQTQQSPEPKRHRSSFEKNLVFIGYTLMCAGVGCNEWVLTKLLSPEGVVEIQNRIAVWLFDILCIALGLFCVKMGKRLPSRDIFLRLSQSYPRTLACSIGLVLTVLLAICAEGIFYGLNQYHKEQVVEDISWIGLPPPDEKGGVGASPPRRGQGWSIPDPFLGYTLPPNVQITDIRQRDGQRLYQAVYTTDAYHRRITPMNQREQRRNFLLFFGCSMTFGLGVNDNETMPFYVAQDASHYRAYNYGVSGYGPHHMLAQLQRGALSKEIHESQGIALYTFIDHHINRAIGAMRVYNQWEQRAPFYTIDAQDNLVRQGDFTSGRPLLSFLYWVLGKSQILQYYNIAFPVSIREEHIRLTARIIAEARAVFSQQFPSAEFYVLLYPGVRRGKAIIPYLAEAGIKYLDYASFIDWPHQELTLPDGAHPTAQGHKIVAAQLAKDLGIFDGDGEQ